MPSRAIEDHKISHGQFRVLAAICSFANNQGFAWPNQSTLKRKAGVSQKVIDQAMKRLKRGKYIEIVSRHRSHPKWTRVMGNVYRVIFDSRLETDKLIADMTAESEDRIVEATVSQATNPPQIEPEGDDGNHQDAIDPDQLARAGAVARWYVKAAMSSHGQLRLVNERAITAALALLDAGHSEDTIRVAAAAELATRRVAARDAPHHLGDCLKVKTPDDRVVS